MGQNTKHLRLFKKAPVLAEPSGLSEETDPEWAPRYPEVPVPNTPSFEMSELTEESEAAVWLPRQPAPPQPLPFNPRSAQMSQQIESIIEELSQITGFIAAAIVNAESGMSLATKSVDPSFAIEVAAAANTEVVRAKNSAMQALQLGDARIEDILITLTTQYHLIRPSANNSMLFIYLALDRKKSNLALARHSLASAESKLDL